MFLYLLELECGKSVHYSASASFHCVADIIRITTEWLSDWYSWKIFRQRDVRGQLHPRLPHVAVFTNGPSFSLSLPLPGRMLSPNCVDCSASSPIHRSPPNLFYVLLNLPVSMWGTFLCFLLTDTSNETYSVNVLSYLNLHLALLWKLMFSHMNHLPSLPWFTEIFLPIYSKSFSIFFFSMKNTNTASSKCGLRV